METTTQGLRREMVETCRQMNATGINQGTAGNLSVRTGDGFLITPSSLPYDKMQPDQYKELKAAYKASYAFRDKIDTDGFNHPKKIYDLTDALLRRGYSDTNIQAVLGGNFRRLLGESWTPQPQVEKQS